VTKSRRILVIGYGNPGRLDDGLGPALAKAVAELELPGVDTDSDYQLTVDDAADVAGYDLVVFADADETGPEPFWQKRLELGSARPTFSTHHVSPAGVLALAKDLFDAEPECWLLGIRGYEFNAFGEGLSRAAQDNLGEALTQLQESLRRGQLEAIRADGIDASGASRAANE
jgi:hydrogenase maturation protease